MKSNKKRKFFNGIFFKSWAYYVLFALAILLILELFQLLLLEPFYTKTLKGDIISMTDKIAQIFFSSEENDKKDNELYSLTSQNNACFIIYDTKTQTVNAYDVLGEGGCAIYVNHSVNNSIIEAMDQTSENTLYLKGQYLDLSNQEVMIYGSKVNINDNIFYVVSNFALQSMNIVMRTIQEQLMIIAMFVVLLALVVSIAFAKIIAKPISDINSEASKLQKGEYDLTFTESSFNELNDLQETLSNASEQLSQIDETRKEVLANVSHDLKTPLTMIKAYAEMIKDISGNDEKMRNEHLDVIIEETDNLTKLVSAILEFSKYQAGAIKLMITEFDLSTALIEIAERFSTVAQKQNVEIVLESEPELVACGDEDKLNEVLYNFVSNALKHVGNDRKVILRAYQKTKKLIRIEVIDHGSGIDEEILPRIWDRYVKADKKYHRAQTGTGLGLAINKAILEEHKFNYGVQTKVNEGSVFWFEVDSAKTYE